MTDIRATKEHGSVGSGGVMVNIAATSFPGTAVHTAVNVSGQKDEIWIYGTNNTATDEVVVLGWGGETLAHTMYKSIPAQDGAWLLIPGWCLSGGLIVTAYCALVTTAISLKVDVNRIIEVP